jgi:hypothetical protein
MERAPHAVTWDGWGAIDEHETARGSEQGRPRVKVVQTAELHDLARRR